MRRHITVILLLFVSFSAWSQTQVQKDSVRKVTDSVRRDSVHKDSVHKATDSVHFTDTVRYHWSYSGTGTVNHSNTADSYVFSNTISASRIQKRSTINWTNNWIYGRQSGNLTNNDFSSTADLSMYKTMRHFYYWGLITYNTSFSLQVNHLIQSGMGIGYNIIDKKKANLIFSDGILFEEGDLYTTFYDQPGGISQRDKYNTVRNSLRLKYRFIINDMISFEGSDFLQNSLAHWNNYILKVNAAINIRVYKWLNLSTAYSYNKFTRTRSENTLLTFGLTVTR